MNDETKPSLKEDTDTLLRLIMCGFNRYTKEDESAMTRIHAAIADPLLLGLTTVSRDEIEKAASSINGDSASFAAGAFWFIGRMASGRRSQ